MGGYNQPALWTTLKFLKEHHKEARGSELLSHQYVLAKGDSPLQDNQHDCGVFMLKSLECLARDSPLNFEQCDIPHIRSSLVPGYHLDHSVSILLFKSVFDNVHLKHDALGLPVHLEIVL